MELSLDAWPNIGVRKSLKPIKVNEAFTSVNFGTGNDEGDASLQQVNVMQAYVNLNLNEKSAGDDLEINAEDVWHRRNRDSDLGPDGRGL